jgi:hypothetical protein
MQLVLSSLIHEDKQVHRPQHRQIPENPSPARLYKPTSLVRYIIVMNVVRIPDVRNVFSLFSQQIS